jgi:hypothetical protein
MKMAAMVFLLLLGSSSGTWRLCAVSQQTDLKSPELEEADKLSRQALSLFSERKFDEALTVAKQALEDESVSQ